ncbi:MAG: TonB-dependent receptor domain-containing protein [Parahaliea sp.]
MSTSHLPRHPLALAITLTISASTVSAQEPIAQADPENLETVVVYGEREPGNVYLTADDFNRMQADTLEDLFANESSIAVGGGSATAQKIYVRGFEDVMLNVTIDGAQTPADLYHHQARVQLEPEFIKSLEVHAGAGAATHGAGALTGAMQVTLKDAFDLLKPGQSIGGMAKATGRFNGEDGQKYSGAVYGKVSDAFGAVVGYTYDDRNNYEDGDGNEIDPSSYERERGFVKFSGSVDAHSYALTYENLQDDATSFERPNMVNFNGRYQVSDQELGRDTAVLNYRFSPATSNFIDVNTSIYYNKTDFTVQRKIDDIIYGDGEYESKGFDLRNTSVISSHTLTYGVDYRNDEVESAQNATSPSAWGNTEQSLDVTGVYIQDLWSLTDDIDLSFGLRYDDYDFEGDSGVSKGVDISESDVSPNISLQWNLPAGFSARIAYAEAFRGVSIREAFFSALYIMDENLEAEEADNIEFGIAWDNDNGYFARGTIYRQEIENFIDAEYIGDPVWGYWRNVGKAEVDGYEVEVGQNSSNYHWKIGVWDADNELNNEPLADSNLGLGTNMGRTWVGRFGMDIARFNADIGIDLRYVEEENNPIASDAPAKNDYFLANLYSNWHATENVTLSLAANNLFDEFYYDHATYTWVRGSYVGYPSRGREIVASLALQF